MCDADLEQPTRALSGRVVKALCAVLHADTHRRDSGLALFEAFDSIDLMSIREASAVECRFKEDGSSPGHGQPHPRRTQVLASGEDQALYAPSTPYGRAQSSP
jgi:hypothetical protein